MSPKRTRPPQLLPRRRQQTQPQHLRPVLHRPVRHKILLHLPLHPLRILHQPRRQPIPPPQLPQHLPLALHQQLPIHPRLVLLRPMSTWPLPQRPQALLQRRHQPIRLQLLSQTVHLVPHLIQSPHRPLLLHQQHLPRPPVRPRRATNNQQQVPQPQQRQWAARTLPQWPLASVIAKEHPLKTKRTRRREKKSQPKRRKNPRKRRRRCLSRTGRGKWSKSWMTTTKSLTVNSSTIDKLS
mmetsp:Transcript_10089/g.22119  ORF Transcript_10089/g.22119 Transcript_10089/m.22119 type:complete len:239 (-) Transcript_10089:907-1623(-)